MNYNGFLVRSLLGIVALTAGLSAQTTPTGNVFVLPLSSASSANTGQSFSSDPFASVGTFPASPVAYQVSTNPAGTQLYVVASSGSQTVQILNAASPNSVIASFNLGQNAVASQVTPDGRNLIVLTNPNGTSTGLNIISTITDQAQTTARTVDLGSNPIDLAVSLDSRYAYVLSGDSLRLTSVDLNTGTIAATQTFPVRPISVALAPTSLIYVTTANAVYELDPTTLAIRSTIAVNGSPGKLQFTPDGRYGVAVNNTPQTGSLAIDVDLLGHAVLGTIPQISGVNEQLKNLVIVSQQRAFATSSLTGTLYDISLAPFSIVPANFSSAGTITGVNAIAATNEQPAARFLFVGTNTSLYRVDLSTAGNPAAGPLPLTNPAGAISYAPASSTATPASLQLFNNNQAISTGQNFLPLVIRALDAQGRPVANAAVNFSVGGLTGSTVSSSSAFTNQLGFAQAIITPGSATGTFPVSVSVGIPGASSQFTLAINTSVPGGGTTGTGTISIYQGLSTDKTQYFFGGQGQLVLESTPALPPFGQQLVVVVRDNQGNAQANQQVTFTLTGGGALIAATGSNCTVASAISATCTTDASGLAYVGYFSGSTNNGTVNPVDSIVATANGSSVTFYETTYSSLVTAQPSVGLQTPPQGSIVNLTAGQTIKAGLVLSVSDRYGRGLPNIAVYLQRPQDASGNPLNTGPGAYCSNGVNGIILTNATGTATCDVTATSGTGQGQILAVVGGGYRYFPLTISVTGGPASQIIKVQGDTQTVAPGTQLPTSYIVQVTDASGNPIAGQTVTFSAVTPNSAVVSPASVTTDSNGKATVRVTAGNSSGTFQIKATSGTFSTTFTFTVQSTVATVLPFGGSPQSAVANTAFAQPLTVLVRDLSNQPVVGQTVTFTVTSGAATLSTTTATTNATGQASVNVTAGSSVGPVVVTATVGSYTTTFNLTVTSATPPPPAISITSFANGASFQTGSLTPGGIVTITGVGIAPGVQGVLQSTSLVGQLPTTLNGTQVLVNGTPAPIFSIVNLNGVEQITIQVPFEITGQSSATVQITLPNNGSVTATNVPVVPYQPGIFQTTDANGNTYAVAVRGTDGSYMSPTNPLRRGENATIFVTGLGQTSPTSLTNSRGQANQATAALIVVALNSMGVQLVSANLLQGQVGIYAVTFNVPLTAPTGAVPIGLTAYTPGTTTNGTNSLSSTVYIQ